MKGYYGVIVIILLGLGMSFHSLFSQEKEKEVPIDLAPKVFGVQTNVTDMAQAVDFYKNFAFEVLTREYYPNVVPLKNREALLVLHKVARVTKTELTDARTTLNLAVGNLDAMINDLKKWEIEVLHKVPQKAAIGIWKSIRDPFGNIVNLIESNREEHRPGKPKVYNVSIVVTDIDKAVDFYSNKLDFDILSIKYYPPVIPLRTAGIVSNIALHESAKKTATIVYPNSTQTFLVIEVEDIGCAMNSLKAKGVEFIHEVPQKAAVGLYAAFKDPFGLVHELLELR